MRLFAPFSCSKVKEQFLFKSDIHVYIYTYICPFAPFSCSKVKKKVSKTSKSTQHSLKVKAKTKTDTSKSTRNKAQETKKTKTSNLNKALDCDHGADAGKKRKNGKKECTLPSRDTVTCVSPMAPVLKKSKVHLLFQERV